MQYTDDEIRASYRRALNKKKQVVILSQLNQCSVERIKEIIKEGINVDMNYDIGPNASVEEREERYGDLWLDPPGDEAEAPAAVKTPAADKAPTHKKAKTDWDAVIAYIEAGHSFNETVSKFGVSAKQLNASISSRKSHAAKGHKSAAEKKKGTVQKAVEPLAGVEPGATQASAELVDSGIETIRHIKAILDLLRPTDTAAVKHCFRMLIESLMEQAGW